MTDTVQQQLDDLRADLRALNDQIRILSVAIRHLASDMEDLLEEQQR